MVQRDFVRALELLRQSNKLGPMFVNAWEIEIYIQNRLFDEALSDLETAKRERKNDPILILQYGHGLRGAGKAAEALQIVKEREPITPAQTSRMTFLCISTVIVSMRWLSSFTRLVNSVRSCPECFHPYHFNSSIIFLPTLQAEKPVE